MGMSQTQPNSIAECEIEFVKGCPLCEHSDPELEREFEEFAQWLYEVMLADRKARNQKSSDIDNAP